MKDQNQTLLVAHKDYLFSKPLNEWVSAIREELQPTMLVADVESV
jgi:hypothetical protein